MAVNTKKGDNVIGLSVITLDDGKKLETVKDIIYDPAQNRVRGLLIDVGGWFSEARVLPIEEVKSIGDNAVIIEDSTAIHKASELGEKVAGITSEGHHLTKNSVVTEDGTELGQITDIIFDTESGFVKEFEVSQGLIKNVASGKKWFRIEDIVTVGDQVTIVRGYTEVAFDEQAEAGGMQGAMSRVKDKGSEVLDTVKEKASNAASTIKEKSQDALETVKDKSRDAMDQAKATAAVATDRAGEIKDNAQSGELKETLRTKVDELKERAENATNRAQDFAQDKKAKVEQKTKQSVIGQYATTNILDFNDTVIIYRGDMITNELVDIAEERGVLDKLLMNTTKEPIIE